MLPEMTLYNLKYRLHRRYNLFLRGVERADSLAHFTSRKIEEDPKNQSFIADVKVFSNVILVGSVDLYCKGLANELTVGMLLSQFETDRRVKRKVSINTALAVVDLVHSLDEPTTESRMTNFALSNSHMEFLRDNYQSCNSVNQLIKEFGLPPLTEILGSGYADFRDCLNTVARKRHNAVHRAGYEDNPMNIIFDEVPKQSEPVSDQELHTISNGIERVQTEVIKHCRN